MPRQERERRYISEFVKTAFPDMNWQLNVELGAVPAEYVTRYGLTKAAALFRPTRPRVDAVRWTKDSYYLIEAKLRDIKAGIGDLLYYQSVIPVTPDLPYYEGQPIKLLLVIPFTMEWIKKVADASNVELKFFEPEWVADYVKERQHYFTAEYREERRKKMELRKILDVE